MISQGAPRARRGAKIARTFPRKKTCTLARVSDAFRIRNETPWWLRDAPRCSGTHEYSWIEILERDGFRCVYCGLDLSASALTIKAATQDHVVPQCLFTPSGDANRGVNLVACCATCNSLKGDWCPPTPDDPAWQSRAAFIGAARRHIEGESNQLKKRYQMFVGAAKNPVPLDHWAADRRQHIAKDREDYTMSLYVDLHD